MEKTIRNPNERQRYQMIPSSKFNLVYLFLTRKKVWNSYLTSLIKRVRYVGRNRKVRNGKRIKVLPKVPQRYLSSHRSQQVNIRGQTGKRWERTQVLTPHQSGWHVLINLRSDHLTVSHGLAHRHPSWQQRTWSFALWRKDQLRYPGFTARLKEKSPTVHRLIILRKTSVKGRTKKSSTLKNKKNGLDSKLDLSFWQVWQLLKVQKQPSRQEKIRTRWILCNNLPDLPNSQTQTQIDPGVYDIRNKKVFREARRGSRWRRWSQKVCLKIL